MGVAQIKEELLKNAELEASFARKDAEKQAREILAQAKDKAEGTRKLAVESATKQAQKEYRKALEAASFEATTSLLKAKKELMDAAIAQASDQLIAIPAETRKRHILALLEKAKRDIQVEYVMCCRKDMPFVNGYKVEEIQISGGLIAENKDRTMRVDLSYDTLFAAVVEESMPQVHQALFSPATIQKGTAQEEMESAAAQKQKRAKK